MFLRIVQNRTFKRWVGQTLAFIFTLDLRRSIKAVGWSYKLGGRCPTCGSSWTEVYEQDGRRLFIEDNGPHETYPGGFCYCAWLSLKPPPEQREKDNPVWVSQRTVERIEKRADEVVVPLKKGRGWITPVKASTS